MRHAALEHKPSRDGEPNPPSRMSRRSFLVAGGLAPLAAALAAARPARATPRIPLAVQLYSVRHECERDFDAALAAVAEMRVEGVEFAGYYSYEDRPADLKRRLDALGLKAAGTHISLKTLQGDALKATIAFHQAIGCRFLIVPGDDAFTDPDGSRALAETFNRLAETLKPLGMACGFHNHTKELEKTGNTTWWDLFAERTSRDVILQQDCGWTFAAGFDPAAYVRKYPGRTRTAHFKPTVREGDAAKLPIIGKDSVDWRAIYAACAEVGGTEWIVVEQEKYLEGVTPVACTRDSVKGLAKLLGW
jgi:sugar phosphate isomerase/epimerase